MRGPDGLDKLKQHQLQHKDRGHLSQRPRPATSERRERAWALDGEGDQRCSHRHGEQCDQIPADRDAPAHTTPGKINDAVTSRERSGDHECADADMG